MAVERRWDVGVDARGGERERGKGGDASRGALLTCFRGDSPLPLPRPDVLLPPPPRPLRAARLSPAQVHPPRKRLPHIRAPRTSPRRPPRRSCSRRPPRARRTQPPPARRPLPPPLLPLPRRPRPAHRPPPPRPQPAPAARARQYPAAPSCSPARPLPRPRGALSVYRARVCRPFWREFPVVRLSQGSGQMGQRGGG